MPGGRGLKNSVERYQDLLREKKKTPPEGRKGEVKKRLSK